MARIKGMTSFSGNFEPQAAGPLDARNIVETQADLLLPATWAALDGLEYTYLGMSVAVHSDPVVENDALYILIDPDFTLLTSWLKIHAVSAPLTQITEKFTITAADAANGYIDVTNTPNTTEHLFVYVNGLYMDLDVLGDYTLSANRINFISSINIDDKIIVKYSY